MKLALLLCLGGLSLAAQAEPEGPCGTLYSPGQYGPFDYRHEPSDKITLVTGAHFLPFVENLERGKTQATPGGDIDYTLRALPNYPRALVAMTRLVKREKHDPATGAHFTAECYYVRALTFRPDDMVVRMLFADFLIDAGRTKDAIVHLDFVGKSLDKEDPFTPYNLGLLYLKVGDTAQALALAHQALALGNPADGLENALKKAGAWSDPGAAPAREASAAAPAASAPAPAASAP